MRRTVYKCFFAWNFDKEEDWLNKMAAKGLILVAVGFCKYIFEECIPGEYNVRLELLENNATHAESQRYIEFVEETGGEYIGSIMRWVYFRGKTDNGEFNLYSDSTSRIKYLNRVLISLGIISITNISIGLSNISIHFLGGLYINFIFSIFSLSLALFAGYGFFRVFQKKSKLKREHDLFE